METNVNFKYYAFISYSHQDEEYAKRIQKKLTEYKLPSVIRKANPLLPDNVRPIFRDATNLTTGMLQGTLHSELEHSKFLIVLCSPNSAKPNDENKHWVNNEVQHFIDIGRAEFIIPVIVGGEPHAENPEEECFCPALLSLPGGDELLGIDIRKSEKHKISFAKSIKRKLGIPDEDDLEEKATVHIVAKMLGLAIDDLWDWNKKAQKRKAYTRLFTAAAIFMVMLTAGLTVYFKKFHVYHKYYVDYVERAVQKEDGTDIEFIGLGRLSKKDIKNRERHYRFDYQGGKLLKIINENSFGIPKPVTFIDFTDRPMIQEMEYNGTTGYLQACINKNANGAVIKKNVYEQYGCVIDLKTSSGSLSGSNGNVLLWDQGIDSMERGKANANIKSYKLVRDENGFVVRQLFFESHGAEHPVKDSNGIAGFEFVLDEFGRPLQTWYLGYKRNISNGNIEETFYRQPLKNGKAGYFFEYDNDFNIHKVFFVNSEGNPISGELITIYEYKNGNRIKELFYDDSGNIFKYLKIEYSDLEHCISYSLHNANGSFHYMDDYYAIKKEYYDNNGNIISVRYYDENNKLCMTKKGYAIMNRVYDSYGNCIETSFYDNNKNPGNEAGLYKTVYSRNKNGFVESISSYDKTESPISIDGIGKVEFVYDDKGQIKEIHYYDIDFTSRKRDFKKSGFLVYEYDVVGNVIKENFFDGTGNLYFSKIINYDTFGHKIGVSIYDVDSKPFISNEGFAVSEHKYDEFGYCTASFYYSDFEKTKLCDTTFGYAYIEYEYDNKGNEIYQKRYNSMKEPASPYCTQKKEYNDNNNLIQISFFDKEDKLTKGRLGFAKGCFEYNNQGKVIKEEFFDEFLKYTLYDGYAIGCYEYDRNYTPVKGLWYNENEELIKEEILGYDDDDRGCIITTEYEAGKCVHKKYDYLLGERKEMFYKDEKLVREITISADGTETETLYD